MFSTRPPARLRAELPDRLSTDRLRRSPGSAPPGRPFVHTFIHILWRTRPKGRWTRQRSRDCPPPGEVSRSPCTVAALAKRGPTTVAPPRRGEYQAKEMVTGGL